MTCRSCGFENMKHATTCARCGARLVWDGARGKRHFQPPRSPHGPLGRRLSRLAEPVLSRGRRMRDALGRFVSSFFTARRIPSDALLRAAVSVLPGAGQFLQRRWRRGAVILALWCAGFIAAYCTHPSFISLAMPGALSLLHSYAIVDTMDPAAFCRTNGEFRLLAFLVAIIVMLAYLLLWLYFIPDVRVRVRIG